MTIYVVLSRDNSDFIYCTVSLNLAQKVQKEREELEEKAGGRPSVYIKATQLYK